MEALESLIPGSEWLQETGLFLWDWLHREVVNVNTLIQLFTILGLVLVATWLARQSQKWFADHPTLPDRLRGIRLHASMGELFAVFYATAFLWGAALIFQSTEHPYKVLKLAATLLFAWGIIRLTSGTIKSRFWSRIIAVLLWTIAALNIVGWLSPTIDLLDEAAIKMGDVRLSLLILVKSLIAFGVLIWVVSLLSHALERSFDKADSLTPSQRVLFFKISNIALFTIAGMVGLNIVGLDLTALTIFSGALGLGIGFGLQKIFSNLISGMILLLDKSVKPGDIIAIGDTFGWVNSLGARCVSVITRDGKEHLIPNENLITQEVENWSYSDQNVRIHIPVGVSYSSDMKKVREALELAIEQHPRVLEYPKPVVLITGFGDSSVDHEIRCWINDPQNGIANVTSEIYYHIWDLFKEHDIEIPFPQRDMNFRPEDMKALVEMLQKNTATSAG